jgi:hypothetical protein
LVAKVSIETTTLTDLRLRLVNVRSLAYVASAALKLDRADAAQDVAIVLQRYVGDELDRQIERIDTLIPGVAS